MTKENQMHSKVLVTERERASERGRGREPDIVKGAGDRTRASAREREREREREGGRKGGREGGKG